MFSDISFSDIHICVDKLNVKNKLNKFKVVVPRCWVLPIKTELVALKGAPATLYLEILRLHNHLDGDDDGNGDNDDVSNHEDDNGDDDSGAYDDNDHYNGRARCSMEGKREVQIILQVVQLDLGSRQWQLVIQ